MKKILFIVLALVISTTTFALPPPKCSKPQHSKPFKIEWRAPASSSSYNMASPNKGMAQAVFISGAVAATLRTIEELQKAKTPPTAIVLEDPGDTVIIKEMEPVVKHPVPISVVPIQIISYP